jgi:hypothetical protein
MALHRRLPRTVASAALPAASILSVAAVAMTAAPILAQAPSSAAELRVLSPRAGDSVGSNSFSMDVSFQASSKADPVTTAELWVDGIRWVRQDLSTPQVKNVLKFQVDGSTLSAGKHAILVKVFSTSGNASQTQILIEAGNNNGVSTGAFSGPEMRFASPGNGKRVQGTVEISIDAKPRNGQDPYITFYVDKQFKTLKNYPPYTLTWDSTQVSNGFHTIEAMGYLDSANATTTTKLKVYVDNAGGNTKRMNEIPDLRGVKKAPLVLGHTSSSVAVSANPTVLTAPKTEAQATLPGNGFTVASKDALKAVPETTLASAANQSVRTISPLDLVTTEAPVATTKLAQSTISDSAPANTSLSVASITTPKLATPAGAGKVSLSTPKTISKPVAAPLVITPRPMAKTTISAPVAVAKSAKTAAHPQVSAKAPRAVVKATPQLFSFSPMQVAFDGAQIAFDVQPRVEAGLPIAPFRQIFEHTGGQVQWVSSTKVLRAVNSDREIVIKVGKDHAMVNGESYKLDRAAFLEQGRTIVPLSFVGKALDVNVQYDSATGRLLITSK